MCLDTDRIISLDRRFTSDIGDSTVFLSSDQNPCDIDSKWRQQFVSLRHQIHGWKPDRPSNLISMLYDALYKKGIA